MRNQLDNAVRIADDPKVEAPSVVHPCLLNASVLIIFLGVKRWMAEVPSRNLTCSNSALPLRVLSLHREVLNFPRASVLRVFPSGLQSSHPWCQRGHKTAPSRPLSVRHRSRGAARVCIHCFAARSLGTMAIRPPDARNSSSCPLLKRACRRTEGGTTRGVLLSFLKLIDMAPL
jgi:hypothetical protein